MRSNESNLSMLATFGSILEAVTDGLVIYSAFFPNVTKMTHNAGSKEKPSLDGKLRIFAGR